MQVNAGMLAAIMPTVCCMGPYGSQLIFQILQGMQWANMSIFPAAILLDAKHIGPNSSLAWQFIVYSIGQCKLIAKLLSHMQLAHARACTTFPMGCCGQAQTY